MSGTFPSQGNCKKMFPGSDLCAGQRCKKISPERGLPRPYRHACQRMGPFLQPTCLERAAGMQQACHAPCPRPKGALVKVWPRPETVKFRHFATARGALEKHWIHEATLLRACVLFAPWPPCSSTICPRTVLCAWDIDALVFETFQAGVTCLPGLLSLDLRLRGPVELSELQPGAAQSYVLPCETV